MVHCQWVFTSYLTQSSTLALQSTTASVLKPLHPTRHDRNTAIRYSCMPFSATIASRSPCLHRRCRLVCHLAASERSSSMSTAVCIATTALPINAAATPLAPGSPLPSLPLPSLPPPPLTPPVLSASASAHSLRTGKGRLDAYDWSSATHRLPAYPYAHLHLQSP